MMRQLGVDLKPTHIFLYLADANYFLTGLCLPKPKYNSRLYMLIICSKCN